MKTSEERQRTERQNRALHKMFGMLADTLNTNGLEMKVVLKHEYEIWWNKETIKQHLFKPVMKAMYNKSSTTQLNTNEVSKVFEQLQKMLGEKFGIEMTFPSIEEMDSYINSLEQIK